MPTKFCIKSLSTGNYLRATSPGFCGNACVWAHSVKDALMFDSAALADATIALEWPDAKRRDVFVQPVG